ncbi:hypothetical protein ACHQM5_029153 [Ranunculus cassubicifolius]
MEDDLKKRNTDCVYFLASPLTCKKGIECEFRHSEIARLNPRDCWYWLSGSCLNPTCAFRHPPVEGRSENPAEPASQPQQPPAPVIKNNFPCYFYFNGFCNKGDNCPFLHSPNSGSSAQSSKAPSSVTTTVDASKTVASTEGVIVSTEQPCFNVYGPPSPQTLVPEIVKSEVTLLPETLRSEYPAEGSGEQFEGQLEPDPEERWESSPGFDVLVDDGSEQLGEGEDGVLPEHYGYDSMVFEPGVYGSYDEHLEDDQLSDHVRRVPRRSRERVVGNYPTGHHKKRQHSSRDVEFNGTDLRNHLQKRRRIRSRSRNGRDHERLYGRVRGRLVSEVRSDRIVSCSESESDSRRRGWSQPRHSSRSKQKDREKRRRARPDPIFSDKSKTAQDAQCTQERDTSFTGPKTLAQIKEEKRKAREENCEGREPCLNGNLKDKTGRRDDGFDGPVKDDDVFDGPEKDDDDLGFDDVDNDDDLIC